MHKSYIDDQYYEAILQLRPYDKEIAEFIHKTIEKKEKVFITKIVEKKFGTDFYINSRHFARSLGNQLKKRFDGKLTMTAELYSRDRQTSRDIYRVTICFRRKSL